jgi:hypothetical protein
MENLKPGISTGYSSQKTFISRRTVTEIINDSDSDTAILLTVILLQQINP